MKLISQPSPDTLFLELSWQELAFLAAGWREALQEVRANDPGQDAWWEDEFQARAGSARPQASRKLDQVYQLLRDTDQRGVTRETVTEAPKKTAHVSFVGAGPGAPDLITVRGARRLAEADLILYAGSLVPEAVLEHAREGAEKLNTAGMNLTEQVAVYERARREGLNVARVHSGDPAIYGATAEQMRALRELEIEYEVVPGVSSFTASAAVLGAELTRPGVTQTIILTRASGRASPVPDAENLSSLAAHRASLCVFLGGNQLEANVAELLKFYPPDTPAALIQRATQPEERRHAAPLGQLLDGLKLSEWALTTMLLVSPALADPGDMQEVSRLYDPAYAHRFRRAEKEAARTAQTSEPE